MSFFNDINTVVYTVSKVPECKNYDSSLAEKINLVLLDSVHGSGLDNRTHGVSIFNDDSLATSVGMGGAPSFDALARLEKTVESVHKKIPGYDSTEGHLWFVEEDKSKDYEKYLLQNPELILSRPTYMFLNRPVKGFITRFDGSEVCRTAHFNYPLEIPEDIELMRAVRGAIDEDWPGARNVVYSMQLID